MPHQHERVAVGLGLALHCYTAAARAAPAGLDRTQNRSAALHCLQELLAPATATLGICVRGLGVTALQLRIPTSRDAASTRLTSLFCCCWKLRMTSTPGSTIQSGCGVTGTSISYHARICPLPPPPANACLVLRTRVLLCSCCAYIITDAHDTVLNESRGASCATSALGNHEQCSEHYAPSNARGMSSGFLLLQPLRLRLLQLRRLRVRLRRNPLRPRRLQLQPLQMQSRPCPRLRLHSLPFWHEVDGRFDGHLAVHPDREAVSSRLLPGQSALRVAVPIPSRLLQPVRLWRIGRRRTAMPRGDQLARWIDKQDAVHRQRGTLRRPRTNS